MSEPVIPSLSMISSSRISATVKLFEFHVLQNYKNKHIIHIDVIDNALSYFFTVI